MRWSVSILPDAAADLRALAGGDSTRTRALEVALLEEFEGLKGERVHKLLRQGASTGSVDRLDGSAFPGSIRIRLFADHRATVLCFPAYEQAFVVHVFHKSRDPRYRKALATHDARLADFVDSFHDFVNRRRRR